MKTMLRWASALCMLSVSTIASAGSLLTGFRVGYNEPWIENYYGNWLATNPFFGPCGTPPPGGTCPTTSGLVNNMFSGMAQGKAKIVRIWLFPALQGMCIGPVSCDPSNPAFTSEFLGNLESVFQLAQRYNLKLYITALNAGDAATVANPNNCPVPVGPKSPPYCPTVSTFYNNVFSSATAYENSVLVPVLNLMSRYQGVIYGFDLINEIESAINAGYFSFSWIGARTWIQNMTKFVKTHRCPTNAIPSCSMIGDWLPVTSSAGGGFAVQELTFGFFSGLGLNFYDVHIYKDSGTYSGQTWLCLRTVFVDHLPIVLGEYGQKSTTVDDGIQNTATTNFLNGAIGAINSCFSSALAWKYELTFVPSSPFRAPELSYLDINTTPGLPTTGGLSPPPCPTNINPNLNHTAVPGPACARPAYTIIQSFCNQPPPPHHCAP
jgi:hypothetical protein